MVGTVIIRGYLALSSFFSYLNYQERSDKDMLKSRIILIACLSFSGSVKSDEWLFKGSFANCRHEVACLVEGF